MNTMRERMIELARIFLLCPTAPFREQAIRDFIIDFCRQRKIRVQQDEVGNVIATYGQQYKNTVFAFAAHMDHPGFIVDADSVGKRVSGLFYGGVAEPFFKGARVKLFTADGSVKAQVTGTDFDIKKRSRKVRLKVDGDVKKGDWGMWDLPACQIRGARLYSRACDDLVGCISVLALLDELHRRKIRKKVQAVFSVAEEAGLHGAKHLCVTKKLSKRTNIVAIETSSELPSAKMGDGVVVRVGDAASIFTPQLTAFLTATARNLKAKDKTFKFQRKLMDGGCCESTIYDRFGYTNAAVCIPLGNYHNQNRKTGKAAAEYVSISDLESMVQLFLAIIKNSDGVKNFLKPKPPIFKKKTGKLGEFFYV